MPDKPRFDSPCDALALMLEDLRALREALASACELHAREPAVLAHEPTAALVTLVRDLLLRQKAEADTLLGTLKVTPGLELKTDSAASALVADFLLRLRKTERSLILRDLSTLLNLACGELSMLHSAALALKETDAARVALDHLSELAPLVLETGRLLPAATVADLASRCVVSDPLAADIARANVHDAWHAVPSTSPR